MPTPAWSTREQRAENRMPTHRQRNALQDWQPVRVQEHRDARVWFDPRTQEYVVHLASGAQVALGRDAVHDLAERERCAFPDVLAPDFVRYMTAARQLAAAGITRRAA